MDLKKAGFDEYLKYLELIEYILDVIGFETRIKLEDIINSKTEDINIPLPRMKFPHTSNIDIPHLKNYIIMLQDIIREIHNNRYNSPSCVKILLP